jgi:hypothetical protein
MNNTNQNQNPPRIHPLIKLFLLLWVLVALASSLAAVAVNL